MRVPVQAKFSFTVTPKLHNQSLLEYLFSNIPFVPNEKWQQALASGAINIDGQIISQDCQMQQGQVINYTLENYHEDEVDTNWKLLWKNHEISAIHKPANLPVSRTTRNVYNTLVQILRRESDWPQAHLLHRLDLETSGIILIGHDNASASKYQANLSNLIQAKVYRAVVYGEPDWSQLDYECELNTLKDSAIRCQMHKVENGKMSRTKFKLLKSNGSYSVVECELLTGRKHQIRAHLASLGHPIVGDKIYSNQGKFYLKRLDDALTQADHDALLTPHQLLHAYKVQLTPDAVHSDKSKEKAGIKPECIIDEHFPDAWLRFCEQQNLII